MAFVCLFAMAGKTRAQIDHDDVEFRYQEGQIVVETPTELGIAPAEFPTSGIFRQFAGEPGFVSEVDAGMGINPDDVIAYNVLGDLMYWDGAAFTPPAAGMQIRIENNGAPDTVVSGESGLQPGGFSPSTNTIGAADVVGDFHSHIDFFLEPNNSPEAPPPPAFGAYGIKLNLTTNAAGIADSVPLFLTFNFGLSDAAFDEAIVAFSGMLPPLLPGDYDRSGDVGPEDFQLWHDTFGSTTDLRADGNDDRLINAADYVVWRNQSERAPAAREIASVPEPAAWLLAAAGGACFVRLRGRFSVPTMVGRGASRA